MLRSTLFLAKGLRDFTRGGYERAARGFDDAVMQRSLAGRNAMVTGALDGLRIGHLPHAAAAGAGPCCAARGAPTPHVLTAQEPTRGSVSRRAWSWPGAAPRSTWCGLQGTAWALLCLSLLCCMRGASVASVAQSATCAARPPARLLTRPARLPARTRAARCAATRRAGARRWTACAARAATPTCISRWDRGVNSGCAGVRRDVHVDVNVSTVSAASPQLSHPRPSSHPGPHCLAPPRPRPHRFHPAQVCDLASLAAIRALAEEWLAQGAPLDLLINK